MSDETPQLTSNLALVSMESLAGESHPMRPVELRRIQ